MRSVRSSRIPACAVLAAAAVAAALGAGIPASAAPAARTAAAAAPAASGCRLDSPNGKVKHVIELTFDNVHFTRDNPNVPSDLEQMPHLLSFLERNGSLLANEHTPLIAHTADDILTTLTGVYGDQHGQPVANSYRVFNSDGSSSPASSFAYWTDPVTASHTTDTAPTMVTPSGGVAPAPWVPFTRAGCDVGAFSTANIEIENVSTDVPTIFGPDSAQEAEVKAQTKQYGYPDLATADYEGIAVHCAKTATSVCAGNAGAVADTLPDEPGGYSGYAGLFGNKYVGPLIGGTATATGVRVNDLSGQPLTNGYASGDVHGTYYGFPGFDVTASQTLGYIAAMQEHAIPVTYGYIEDAHANYGPGDPRYEANLKADDQAFAAFFSNLAQHGINAGNTLFVVSSDEGDHFAGDQLHGCDGVQTPCTYQPGQVGEVDANVNGLLAQQASDTASDFAIESDTAPVFYVNGQPGATAARVRQLEHELSALSAPDPYARNGQGATVPLVQQVADQTEQGILHMDTGDPHRTATFTAFASPDFYVTSGKTSCAGPSGDQTGTGNPCVVIEPSYAWNHGALAPDINTNWVAFAGPGVSARGVDRQTWADETDVRPTLLALTGLADDHPLDGRVLTQDLTGQTIPPGLRGNSDTRLAAIYKQLDADVGSFGLDTLAASTAGVRSTDPASYARIDAQLAKLAAERNSLAGQIAAALNAAAFRGQPVNEHDAQRWISQGESLLNQARELTQPAP